MNHISGGGRQDRNAPGTTIISPCWTFVEFEKHTTLVLQRQLLGMWMTSPFGVQGDFDEQRSSVELRHSASFRALGRLPRERMKALRIALSTSIIFPSMIEPSKVFVRIKDEMKELP